MFWRHCRHHSHAIFYSSRGNEDNSGFHGSAEDHLLASEPVSHLWHHSTWKLEPGSRECGIPVQCVGNIMTSVINAISERSVSVYTRPSYVNRRLHCVAIHMSTASFQLILPSFKKCEAVTTVNFNGPCSLKGYISQAVYGAESDWLHRDGKYPTLMVGSTWRNDVKGWLMIHNGGFNVYMEQI